MFTFMLGVTRVWYSMSRDGLLPRYFAKTSATHHVPMRVTWIVGIGSALLAGFVPIREAAELTNIGILLAFVLVCIAVIVLRYRRPEINRPFRLPVDAVRPGPRGGLLALADHVPGPVDLAALRSSGSSIGLVIYFLYSYRHSAMNDRSSVGQQGPEGPST